MPKGKLKTQPKQARYRVVGLFNSILSPRRTWPRYTQKAAEETLVRIEKNALFSSGKIERLDGEKWVEVTY